MENPFLKYPMPVNLWVPQKAIFRLFNIYLAKKVCILRFNIRYRIWSFFTDSN